LRLKKGVEKCTELFHFAPQPLLQHRTFCNAT